MTSDVPINVATTNTPVPVGVPLLNLSMTDKMYLAVSRKQVQNLHFVYYLFCRQDVNNKTSYYANPESAVATFLDAAQADLFYSTLTQIQAVQSNMVVHRNLSCVAKNYISDFNNKTR